MTMIWAVVTLAEPDSCARKDLLQKQELIQKVTIAKIDAEAKNIILAVLMKA